jgi:excinuclease ABC subunit C
MFVAADAITAKLPHLPESPGVYLWKDADGVVLYVGKAKRLRSRVRSYLASDHLESVKTRALMHQAAELDTIVVPTEAHALILEANLIKEYRPRFNIALRDDKSYPYIKVTIQEPFPRVFVTRRLIDDGAKYFGPYTDVGQMRRALNVVKRIFTVRSCNYDMPQEMPERACLDYHIGRCKAPCILAQSQADYGLMIDEVLLFLDGRADEVIRRVRDRMEDAAATLDFERAAELRDALRHLERMEEPTVVLEVEGGDRDVIGYARDGDDACVAILRIRRGKLLARDHRFVENIDGEDDAAVLSAYLALTYVTSSERASELLVPFDFEDREAIEESARGTRVVAPQRGPRRELVDLAQQNARHLLEELKLSTLESEERATNPVYELGRELGLQRLPRSLVCFDISTAQGTDTVGSCVWFENGRARRGEYRKFKVKSVVGTDDFASMREVVGRYFRRRVDEQKALPDLVVIDGGKGQLGAAAEALRELQLDTIQLISLAKREEEIYVLGRADPVRLPRRSPGLRMLQQARDEAHRFAVTYNRKRRSLRTVTSELLSIPGIGPSKRRLLLKTFGSVQGVRDATVEEIAALPGFSIVTAGKLLDSLSPRSAGTGIGAAGASAGAGRVDGADVVPNVPTALDDDPSVTPLPPRTPETP